MSNREQRGLGKGLSALLGEVPSADQLRKPVGYINKEIAGSRTIRLNSDIMRIPVDMIEPNPFQPRGTFNQEAIDELAASIRSLGLIQPITVRRTGENKYQIISGERRFRACRQAGMSNIPAYIRDANDEGMLEMAIVENIQRENLDPIEEAMSFQRLIDECSLTQEETAAKLGKKRTSVANSLRLLKLPVKAQHDLKVGQISVGHAKVILGIDDPQVQEQLCDLVISEDLSVRQLEERIRELQNAGSTVAKKPKSGKTVITKEYASLRDHFGKILRCRPVVHRNASGSGSITVKFVSDKEVKDFLSKLEEAGL